MRNTINLLVRYSLSIFFCLHLIMFSCDSPHSQMFRTDRPADRFDFHNAIDSTQVFLKTVREDSIRSDEFSRDLLGYYNDPVFGKTKVSLFTQIRLPKDDVVFNATSIIDSVVLHLTYSDNDAFFGWLNSQMHLQVYESAQDIFLDSPYYSTSNIKLIPDPIGTWQGIPNPKAGNRLNITLSAQFGQKFLNASKAQLESDREFISHIKGIGVVPKDISGYGSVLFFNLVSDSSNITVYYRNGADEKRAVFQITNRCPRINTFEHDFSGTEVAEQLSKTETLFPSVFLKPLSGVKIQIDIPYLKNFVTDQMLLINHAQLIIKVDDRLPYLTRKPQFLLLLKTNEKNENLALPDRFENYFGGFYDPVKMEYRFVITRHIQELLKNYYQNPDYEDKYRFHLIIASDNPIIADPLIIQNLDGNGKAASVLKLSFTQL